MSNTFPYVFSGDDLTIFLRGVPRTINSRNFPNAAARLTELIQTQALNESNEEEILKLLDPPTMVREKLVHYGDVGVGQDIITYRGEPVRSYLAQRMLQMIAKGHDVAAWAKFMDKLYQNPSRTAVEELYQWLEKANMPLTPAGNFLAYKKVRSDYRSYHASPDGTHLLHEIGKSVSMPRNQVDDNRDRTCSHGLHFCSWHYLPHYYGNEGRVLILEINPKHVVTIPSDYDDAKGRAEEYLVYGEIDEASARFAFEDVLVAA